MNVQIEWKRTLAYLDICARKIASTSRIHHICFVQVLSDISQSQNIVPTTVEYVDIAGLVKGASKGEGLGNKFLANIRECDSLVQVRPRSIWKSTTSMPMQCAVLPWRLSLQQEAQTCYSWHPLLTCENWLCCPIEINSSEVYQSVHFCSVDTCTFNKPF